MLMVLLWAPVRGTAEGPFVELTFDAACARARGEQKVALLDFSTEWCTWCRKLDRTTWKDAAVVRWMGEHVIAIRVDGDRERGLVDRFGVKSYPTLVFVNADGSERGRLNGYLPPKVFLARADLVLAGKPVPEDAGDSNDPEHDPMRREQAGDLLVLQGKRAEALEEYLWCWDEGEVYEDSYSAVRRSFLLGSLVQLGAVYPPALQALRERRERAVAQVRQGEGARETVRDICAIDESLVQRRKSLELLDAIKDDDHVDAEVREALAKEMLDLLVEDRRYRDVTRWIAEIPRWVSITLEKPPEMEHDPGPLGLFASLEAHAEESHRRKRLEEAGLYYEALLGSELSNEAGRVAGEVLGAAPEPESHLLLARHAWRANQRDLAQDHVDRALEDAKPGPERVRLAKTWREFLDPSSTVSRWWPWR
jgi:thiol-disulfide isomerase/thioredoxin